MLTFPADIQISNIKLETHQPAKYAEGANFTAWTQKTGYHRTDISFQVTMTPADSRKLEAFYAQLGGRANMFKLWLPERSKSAGSVTGLVKVKDPVAVGVNKLTYTSLGTFAVGDLFTIANDPKVYMVVDSHQANKEITFVPELRKAIAKDDVISHEHVMFTVRLAGDKTSVSSSTGFVYKTTIKVTEV